MKTKITIQWFEILPESSLNKYGQMIATTKEKKPKEKVKIKTNMERMNLAIAKIAQFQRFAQRFFYPIPVLHCGIAYNSQVCPPLMGFDCFA